MYMLSKARERKPRDLDQVKCIKDEDSKVLVEEEHIRQRWQAFSQTLEPRKGHRHRVGCLRELGESGIFITVGILRLRRLTVLCVR